jgi:hypothetical protein
VVNSRTMQWITKPQFSDFKPIEIYASKRITQSCSGIDYIIVG